MGRFFATVYDPLALRMERGPFTEIRRGVLDGLHGRVLEIGAGSGFNFPHYPATVQHVTATDPDRYMLRKARTRAAAAPVPVEVRDADAQALPFDDVSFEAAVGTLVFCSIPDPERAFQELRRVVRPGGPVRLLEHVASRRPLVFRTQRTLTPVWRRLFDNCHLDRDTLAAVLASGLYVETVRRHGMGLMPLLEIHARA